MSAEKLDPDKEKSSELRDAIISGSFVQEFPCFADVEVVAVAKEYTTEQLRTLLDCD